MRSWLERARAIVPKRAIKRGSSDLPTLENVEEQCSYLRGLLGEDSSLGYRQLREGIRTKGFLVSEKTMRNWLDRHNGKCKRLIIVAPIEGLPCLDVAGLRFYQAQLLERWSCSPSITYTVLKEWLEQTHGVTCTKKAMQNLMQTPFKSMVIVSIDVLCEDKYGFLFKLSITTTIIFLCMPFV